jgi:heme A synthase
MTLPAFRAFAVGGAIVAYSLAMLGSWTRINGAGMACPDWPLCHGAVVPVLHGGIVLEWLHRLLAGIETFVVAGLILTGLRLRAAIPPLGAMLLAAGAIFVLQVLLGGVTIFLANSPLSVMFHWGAAMLLLTILTSIVVVAFVYRPGERVPAFDWRRTPLVLLTAVALFAAMCAGALVSSSGAGLACPGVPGCGPTFMGQTPAQALQMGHRFLAGIVAVLAVVSAIALPRSLRKAAVAVRVGLVLIAVQITLGVLNVVWLLPEGLREAHAANAVATFLSFVVATVLAAIDPARVPASASARAQAAVPETV